MARVMITVTCAEDAEGILMDAPDWGDLTAEEKKALVVEAAETAIARMQPSISYYEMAD